MDDQFFDDQTPLLQPEPPDDASPVADPQPAPAIPIEQTLLGKLYCQIKIQVGKIRIVVRITVAISLFSVFWPRDFTEKAPPRHNGIHGIQLISGNNAFPISSLLADDNGAQVLVWDSLMKMLPPEKQHYPGKMTFVVPIGREILKIRLIDSTVISLAPGSLLELSPSYGERTRHLTLAGEAFFQVHPYRNKVLTIQSDQMQIVTAGASFNVAAFSGEDGRVSLIDGSIYIHGAGQTAIPGPGKAIIRDRITGDMYTKTINTESVISWQKQGRYMFTDRTINEMLKQLERLYGVPIVVENDRTGNHSYTGCITKSESLINILESLRNTDSIEYRFNKEGVIHVRRKE